MNTPVFTHALILTLLAGAAPLSAQEKKETNAKTTAYQTSVSQEQLRGNTRRLKTEMIALLEEYSQYQAASGELGKLKHALGELDTVSEQDMLAVVKILREASRAEKLDDAKAKLVEASSAQKEIQSLLRSIADRLTLQKQEAEIRQRLDNLALRQMANLRDTKKLAESGEKPEKVKGDNQKTQQVNKAEQDALKKEVGMMMDALKNLAEKSESPDKEAFEEVMKTGEQNAIRMQAEQSNEMLKSDFTEAARAQEQLLQNLQKMSQELQKRATSEEKARELADKLDQLSQKQDQLAAELPKAWGNEEKQEIRKEQEKLADELKLAEESLAKVNPEAANEAKQAQQQSDALAQAMKDKKAMDKIDAVAAANDQQRAIGEKLEKASDMLKQQAEQLAGNEAQENQSQESSAETNSQQQEAISNAVNQVMEAKTQMALAKKQLQDGGNQDDAKRRLDEAQNMLNEAKQELSQAGDTVPKQVGEELGKADENIGKAEQGIGAGSKQDQEKSRWNLDKANENANRALAGLQQAANQMAAKQGQEQGRQQAANQQKGTQTGNSQQDAQGAAGSMGKDKGKETNISAVTDRAGGQREALQLLQQEKAPTEYETMVQQYIRNLAEAAASE
jgi:hypothetical protein